jgi:hypothetical protein
MIENESFIGGSWQVSFTATALLSYQRTEVFARRRLTVGKKDRPTSICPLNLLAPKLSMHQHQSLWTVLADEAKGHKIWGMPERFEEGNLGTQTYSVG